MSEAEATNKAPAQTESSAPANAAGSTEAVVPANTTGDAQNSAPSTETTPTVAPTPKVFPKDKNGEHALQSTWTFWYTRNIPKHAGAESYEENLHKLGSFSTVEGFYRFV